MEGRWKKNFKRFWEAVCTVDTFGAVLEWFGWKGVLLAMLVSWATGIASMFHGQPLWVVILSTLGALVSVLLILNFSLNIYIKYKIPPPQNQNPSSQVTDLPSLNDIKLSTESPLSILTVENSRAIYFIIERFVLTNTSNSDAFSLDMHLLIHGTRKIQPLQHPLEKWENLQALDEAIKVNFLSFPLRMQPKSVLCGYIAFRFQDKQDFMESMFSDTPGTFTTAAMKVFSARLILSDLEAEQHEQVGFISSNLVAGFTTTMSNESSMPSFLRLSQNPIEIKRLP
ncbi:MAG: hypothetical protein WD032_02485 [Nitrospirales bacterium]